ncbi:enoyl-CoA hydratase/isomerase family protein [Halobacillus karajensis]|uniref:3-hydroxyisobutyryl-CoA hydrolase n=1 Tax=Halobacillus karajensis TaxID=195088 RepID=A0A024P647_9BACI|nr:enoyl-CoA hydratase/isomerase family protein [Halobacillus karajensis]CDQ20708.1 putative enoyl-CoA hydratase echA8 [Halobacillus karajensis]CDQ23822.1 putative enoyl-CoA hydratase echA8 [Halobacillus karajensis]CDQ27300.1 putative enoyl-CoA hydratase echA8 [Halobacillus karajensis]
MSAQVLFSQQENGVASIILNRPEAIHSLNYDMLDAIGKKLKEWEQDDRVLFILLKGTESKGFCAGGDIKTLYEAQQSQEAMEKAVNFFEREYEVDEFVHSCQKPIVACLDGIVMGGGVGLSYGADFRIVTEKTKWAMPEMNIGFFPDVGAAYFLNRAPGYTGRYVALSASVLSGADALYIKAADYYMSRENLNHFLSVIEATDWHKNSVETTLQRTIEKFSDSPSEPSELRDVQHEIDEHFSKASMEEMTASLQKSGTTFAEKTHATLLSKSPCSLKVTLQQLIHGEGKSIKECLERDLIIAKNFLLNEDFYEGIRSVLIDKDHRPDYRFKRLSDVDDQLVRSFFTDRNILKTNEI